MSERGMTYRVARDYSDDLIGSQDQGIPLTDAQLAWLDRVQAAVPDPYDRDLAIWCQVDAERWHRELHALADEIDAWLVAHRAHRGRDAARGIAECARISAERPDAVVQDAALKYWRGAFDAIRKGKGKNRGS